MYNPNSLSLHADIKAQYQSNYPQYLTSEVDKAFELENQIRSEKITGVVVGIISAAVSAAGATIIVLCAVGVIPHAPWLFI